MKIDEKFYYKFAWFWIIGFGLIRLFYSAGFPLIPDETNYWQWSRHLDWGYHDQAPMLAWLIRLSTTIFGQNEMSVRLPSVIAVVVTSAFLLKIAFRWFNPRIGFATAIITQSVMEFNVGGLLATTDALQAAAWAGASYYIARGYEKGQLRHWLLGGAWFGFGLLSKFTMIIFPVSVFLYGLISSIHRKRLTNYKPYLGVLLGFVMFSPVILWNARHGWNSVRHVAYIGGANEKFALHFNFFGDHIGAQAALLSPLAFILVIIAWYIALKFVLNRNYKNNDWLIPYLFFASFPMFAGFTLLSFHSRVYGNWPGASYLTVSILIAVFFSIKTPGKTDSGLIRFGKKLYPWAISLSYILTFILLFHNLWPILPVPTRIDRTILETAGWKELGNKTDEILKNEMPNPKNTFIFGLKYQYASELAFYTPGQPETVSINRWTRPNVYDYWFQDSDLIGMDAVGVTSNPSSHLHELNQVFEKVDDPVKLEIYREPMFYQDKNRRDLVTIFYIYKAYGFKGGINWISADKNDIRVQ